MKYLAVVIALVATPLSAQEEGEGLNLMEEAMRLFMQGLLAEMEPALDDLRDLVGKIDSYHAPEILPNGDILIRRKSAEEMELDAPEEGEVDL